MKSSYAMIPDVAMGYNPTWIFTDANPDSLSAQAVDLVYKGVSPEYLHKSGYWLGFCPVEAIADYKLNRMHKMSSSLNKILGTDPFTCICRYAEMPRLPGCEALPTLLPSLHVKRGHIRISSA